MAFVINFAEVSRVVAREIERQKREFLNLPKNRVHKLTLSDAVKVWELKHHRERSLVQIADEFNVRPSTISSILTGRYFPEAEKEFLNKFR